VAFLLISSRAAGMPDNVRATQHDGVRPFDLYSGLLEQVDAAIGSAWDEKRLTPFLGQAANI